MQPGIVFPQYRRYLNSKNYFCFFSPESFEEVRSIGSAWIIETHTVKILPDRNLVHDLLFDYHGIAEVITSAEYDQVREKAGK